MLPALQLKPSSLPRWLQYLLMVVAGIGSFYGALQLGPSRVPEDGGVELRKKSANVQATPEEAANTVPLATQTNTQPSSSPTLNVGQSTRLDAGILQNPFGALNIAVTVESLLTPLPPPVTEVRAVRPPKVIAPPPPPPPVVQVAPPVVVEPTAPPLPFKVLGSIQGDRIAGGVPVVFLTDRNATLVVRAGDQIDNTYRVERITPDRIDFTYLPLKTAQSLPISH
jgi:hypothetical protein